MSDAIITVENLSKKYLVGHQSGSQSRSNPIIMSIPIDKLTTDGSAI
jgi:hypothetical protein